MKFPATAAFLLLAFSQQLKVADAFVASPNQLALVGGSSTSRSNANGQQLLQRSGTVSLRMGLDLVTYLRTEWISAALCTNQTPRSADVCLQLGTDDGRAVTFVPRTIRQLITSSAEPDGKLSVSARRQLKQNEQRRQAGKVMLVDQPADDLKETEDESVDVVISLQAAAKMVENGLDWKKSIREAARVLKPGGRLLFVEQTELKGEEYLAYVQNLYTTSISPDTPQDGEGQDEQEEVEYYPVFEEVGFDPVDMVLTPHIAGVAIKAEDSGMTAEERAKKAADEEKNRLADLSITAFERGLKKRKKKKKKTAEGDGKASSS